MEVIGIIIAMFLAMMFMEIIFDIMIFLGRIVGEVIAYCFSRLKNLFIN